MTVVVIVRRHHDDSFCEPVVEIADIIDRPLQELSEEQMAIIPDQFRCYCCQGKFKRELIGGIELKQRLCRFCYPWVDRRWLWGLIRFDLKHGKPVEGFGCPKTIKHKPKYVIPMGVSEAVAEFNRKEAEHMKRFGL